MKEIWLNKEGYQNKDWDDDENLLDKLKDEYLDKAEIKKYFKREAAANCWARSVWEKATPQLFLARKENYDSVEAEIVTCTKDKKHLMKEIYYRLKDEEQTIGEIVETQRDILKGTMKPIQVKLSEMSNTLKYYVSRARVGKYYGPITVDDKIMIFRILSKKQSILTDEIKQEIIDDCMRRFLEYGSQELCEYVCNTQE